MSRRSTLIEKMREMIGPDARRKNDRFAMLDALTSSIITRRPFMGPKRLSNLRVSQSYAENPNKVEALCNKMIKYLGQGTYSDDELEVFLDNLADDKWLDRYMPDDHTKSLGKLLPRILKLLRQSKMTISELEEFIAMFQEEE